MAMPWGIEDGFSWTWITTEYLLSSIPYQAEHIREMHDRGISAILSLTKRSITCYDGIDETLLKELDITWRQIAIPDATAPNAIQMYKVSGFLSHMKAIKRKTLIHCRAGIGRSGACLAVHLAWTQGSLPMAKEMVQRRKSYVGIPAGPNNTIQRDFVLRMTDNEVW